MKISAVCSRLGGAMALLFAGAILFAGCLGRKHVVSNYEFTRETKGASLPIFLAGPAAALLTNGNGFSARVTLEQTDPSNKVATVSGLLLVRGTRMMFAPKEGDNTFIWDVQERTGFILSEALQGYAPIASGIHITKDFIVSEKAGPTGEQVNGHPGHEAEVAVTTDDGATTTFGVWRAADMNDFPIRIRSLKSPASFTLNLTGIRSEDLEPKLFLPPEGFTKYPTGDTMVGEYFARRSKSKIVHDERSVEPRSGVQYSH
jgi:hypothetical protein